MITVHIKKPLSKFLYAYRKKQESILENKRMKKKIISHTISGLIGIIIGMVLMFTIAKSQFYSVEISGKVKQKNTNDSIIDVTNKIERQAKKEARNRLYPAVLSPSVLRVTIRDIIEPNSVRAQIMLTSPKCKGVSAMVSILENPSASYSYRNTIKTIAFPKKEGIEN